MNIRLAGGDWVGLLFVVIKVYGELIKGVQCSVIVMLY
jgi:hypothetical protein